jgi:excisionase family DNA binding protein
MSATPRKSGKHSPDGSLSAKATHVVGDANEVLTLSEAAAYLRVAEEEVLRLATAQELPGRRIGGDWRFLKGGLQDWLRAASRRSGKDAVLALAGAWHDDPDVEQMVRQAHRRRGRPVADEE